MKVSTVMSTYNGRRYLPEMLDSIRKQTREIDEVLIYDDKSSDETVSYIDKYIAEHKLVKWKLKVNKTNLGWERNFFQGLKKATGDVIFLCDQDDIWHEERIEKMTRAFEENDDIWLLASGFHAFTETGGEMIYQQSVKTESQGIVSKVTFDKHYYKILRPGCTMAFRKDLLPMFEENWEKGTPHDVVLWVVAALLDKLFLYDQTFIEYRRHANNASRSIKYNYLYTVNEIVRTIRINQWYLKSEYYKPEKRKLIESLNIWCDLRNKLLTEKKFFAWLKLFKYREFYFTQRQYLVDGYYFVEQFKDKNTVGREH
ncbi:glycosyltransferase [Eubacteriaceae bacterium ES3]|nr:glycosyltransferase [Eubacteriaceae bacterium ES3]